MGAMRAMDSMGSSMSGAMVVWMLLWVLITVGALTLIVLGVARLARGGRRDRQPHGGVDATPREVLDRRYAAGEIEDDEYLTRISHLEQP